MRLSLTYVVSLFGTRRLTLAFGLGIAWWALVGLVLAVLALDGVLFLLFGADTAVPPPTEASVPLRLDGEAVKRAASALQERRDRFESSVPAPDLASPFR